MSDNDQTMSRVVSALIAGTVFGLGLSISGMVNPAKVLGFLDLFGAWDPSLVFVIGAGLVVAYLGYRYSENFAGPIYANKYQIPTNTVVDRPLAIGAVLFGAGWGLVGLCPGPALAALATGNWKVVLFVVSMFAGFYLHRAVFD